MKFRRMHPFILVLLLTVAWMSHAYAGFSMDMLDVGAGDCLLLRSGQSVMLIDTGPARAWQHIDSFLQEQDIPKIDLLLLTHSHPDHCGNTTRILAGIPVGEILMSSADTDYHDDIFLQAASLGIPIRTLTRGDRLSLDGVTFDVLWPGTEPCALVNDRCVVLRAEANGFTMLLMADAESETERYLLHTANPSLLHADLIKLGHHGMLTSSTYPLIRAVQPTYALVSCADSTHNATLSPIVRDTLDEFNVPWILTTSEIGDIHLEISDSGILIIR